jgi:hypothetical protein
MLTKQARQNHGKGKNQATTKAKCGDLSTARRTMRLSVASVETIVGWGEQATAKANPPASPKNDKQKTSDSKCKSKGNG